MLHWLERRNDEGVLAQLVSESLFGFVLGAKLLKLANWLLLIEGAQALREVLASKMGLLEVLFDIAVELPHIDSVTLSNTDDLRVVSWVEHDAVDWICVSNKALEVVWNRLLSFIVPNLNHAILTSCQKIPGVVRNIHAINAASVDIGNFSKENTFVFDQAVELNFAIFGNNEQISIIISKLKGLDNAVHHYLMLDEEGFRVVDYNIVAILSHKSESLVVVIQYSISEGHMNELWRKFQVEHLDWQMASSSVVDRD